MRTYKIMNVNSNGENLSVSVQVSEQIGTKNDEWGNPEAIIIKENVGVVIPIAELPATQKKAYVMNKLKLAYIAMKTEREKYKAFIGYEETEE